MQPVESAHDQRGHDQRLAPADAVAEMTKQDAAERARDEADTERPERDQRALPGRGVGEEQVAEHERGGRPVDEEVVPLQRRAHGGAGHHPPQLPLVGRRRPAAPSPSRTNLPLLAIALPPVSAPLVPSHGTRFTPVEDVPTSTPIKRAGTLLPSSRAHVHTPRGSPQRRHHRPRRSRQDDAGRRDAVAERRLPREPGRRRARDGLDGPRTREGHHDPRQEHVGPLPRRQAQHRRHAGPRRLRRRGRARADDGRRRAAAGRRLRGPAAADALRPAQGARVAPPGDPRRQQGRPARRAHRRGGRRGLRAVHRPRRGRGPDRLPDRLHERQGRLGRARAGRRGHRPRAADGPAGRAHPRARLRRDRAAAGARHEPRRLALRRPAGDLPRAQRDDPPRRADRLVPRRRHGRERQGGRALRHRGARPRRRRGGRAGRDHRRRRACRASRSARRWPTPTIRARCR